MVETKQCDQIFVKVSKSFIFLVKSFLGIFKDQITLNSEFREMYLSLTS